MNRLILKSDSACFTGHRKVFEGSKSQLKSKVGQTIVSLYERGVTCYYCGMAIGFDMLAAEVVLELKDTCPDIQLIAVVPFRRQYVRYSETDKKRYFRLLGKADRQIILREDYSDRCYLQRNDYMLEHSMHVIAYFDGKPKGGTFYTYNRALRRQMNVVNLY